MTDSAAVLIAADIIIPIVVLLIYAATRNFFTSARNLKEAVEGEVSGNSVQSGRRQVAGTVSELMANIQAEAKKSDDAHTACIRAHVERKIPPISDDGRKMITRATSPLRDQAHLPASTAAKKHELLRRLADSSRDRVRLDRRANGRRGSRRAATRDTLSGSQRRSGPKGSRPFRPGGRPPVHYFPFTRRPKTRCGRPMRDSDQLENRADVRRFVEAYHREETEDVANGLRALGEVADNHPEGRRLRTSSRGNSRRCPPPLFRR